LSGLASVPTDPEQARTFIQRRLEAFVGVCALMWALGGGAKTILATTIFGHHLMSPGVWPLLLAILLLVGLWVALRMWRFSVVSIWCLDAVTTLSQITTVAIVSRSVATAYRPDLAILLVASNLLVLRAAVVPSKPSRTVAIGVLAWVPIVAVSVHIYRRSPLFFSSALGAALLVTLWSAMAVGSSYAVARVIYGLRQSVQAAMELGQYTLESKIGEGGMGVVYRARHALLRRPTAVKLLLDSRCGAASVARFAREVQLTSRLSHPNIVAVYDFGRSSSGVFYYAMEFLDGIDIQRLVDEHGPQPPGRAVHIMRQAADALAEAHAEGLIHRDVKPANLILCDRRRQRDLVKVVDFGLVRDTAQADPALSDVRTLTGTPLYMSPEAILNPEKVDGRCDVYALGNVGYFIVTGRPAFEGRSVVEVCGHHLHSQPEPPSKYASVPRPLEEVILACLEKDASKRPTSAELVERLVHCGDLAWTSQVAQRWWSERGPAIRAKTPPAATPLTLAIDPVGRLAVG
jgi:serine/threonine-protein kinase